MNGGFTCGLRAPRVCVFGPVCCRTSSDANADRIEVVNENRVDYTSHDERSTHSPAFGAGDSQHTVLCSEFEQGFVWQHVCCFQTKWTVATAVNVL